MSEAEDFEVAKHVISCLHSTPLAVLSTKDNKSVWGMPVYFIHDNDFNFYAITNSRSRPANDIKNNPDVCLSIVMPPDSSNGFEVGIQIAGRASKISGKDIVEIYAQKMKRSAMDREGFIGPREAEILGNEGGIFIKIVPKLIMYLDRRYHGPQSKKVSIKRLAQLSKYIR